MALGALEIPCKHWKPGNVNCGGICTIGLHGGRPGYGTCLLACEAFEGDEAERKLLAERRLAEARERAGHTTKGDVACSTDELHQRADTCRSCEHLNRGGGGVRLTVRGRVVNRVVCRRCGCGSLSLLYGRCPENRWNATGAIESKPAASTDSAIRSLVLINGRRPGDLTVMSAAIRDLHLAFPGRYRVWIATSRDEIFSHHPGVLPGNVSGSPPVDATRIDLGSVPLIQRSNENLHHYTEAYHEALGAALGITIPVTERRPDIRMSQEEKNPESLGKIDSRLVDSVRSEPSRGGFWLVNAGGDWNTTAKWWPYEHYQAVINATRDRVRWVQVGSTADVHPELEGVIRLTRTSIRDLVVLAWHARGVLCPVTWLMHLAAAFRKPAVVVAGGREPVAWERYEGHVFFDSIGRYECCKTGGCWRSMCHRKSGEARHDSDCALPVMHGDVSFPKCMSDISPERVTAAVEGIEAGLAAIPTLYPPVNR